MSQRLFHTIVLAGASLGLACATAGCGGSVEAPVVSTSDAGHDAPMSESADAQSDVDAWPGIRPAEQDAGAEADAWPTISIDAADAWSGIAPNMDAFVEVAVPGDVAVDTADGWPGISPPPIPDVGVPVDSGWIPISPAPPPDGGIADTGWAPI